ncbi:hypothetical protein ACXR6G_14100 [Ancylomarina sp. YFZ004]
MNSFYTYEFFVNGLEVTAGVSGNTFTISDLNTGDPVKVRLTDSNGCQVESSEIIMTVHAKPSPRLYFE